MEQVQVNTKPVLESSRFKVLALGATKDKILTIMPAFLLLPGWSPVNEYLSLFRKLILFFSLVLLYQMLFVVLPNNPLMLVEAHNLTTI